MSTVRRLAPALVVVALLAAVGCTVDDEWRATGFEIDRSASGEFYEVPADLGPGRPGDLIRSERLVGAPTGSTAWRVLYRSTDARGDDVVVSGVVVAPNGSGPGSERPVLSWGHPTTGAAPHCAPSRGVDPFVLIEGLSGFIADGYTVVATDYPGMGVEGPSSYLIGGTAGHSVLDAARAARQIPEAGAGDDLLLWGHSQGGQAVLFAAQEASTYAPELDLHGVAAAAPAAELSALLTPDIDHVAGVTIGSYALSAYADFYGPDTPGATLSSVLTEDAQEQVGAMADLCLLGQQKELHSLARPLVGNFVTADLATTAPWDDLLDENTPGGAPIDVPVLIAQGLADQLVVPRTTDEFVERLCEQREHVQYRTYERIDHGLVGFRAVPLVRPWFRSLLAGDAVPDTCPS